MLRSIRYCRCLLAVLALILAFPVSALEKHADDRSVSRTLTLDNGLKVLLVSDPDFNRSAASVDVRVGSLADPRQRQGLAHFLEHMLFLGTGKYPEVNDYSKFLQNNGGYANAFTSDSHTNYHFEVRHESFEEALDRFAQFYIAPLFTPEFTGREVKAVQSEHKKNLLDDGWRYRQLIRRFLRKDHPANHFGTGSEKTLAGVTDGDVRAFYEKHYSANLMGLCLLGSRGLDELEALARAKFAAVQDKQLTRPTFEPDFMPQAKTFRLIEREPVKDLKDLRLVFSLPGLDQYVRGKPASLIGHCIGHEGAGSLLSYLKAQDLATGLSAGGGSETADYGRFSITIQLTDVGVERYREVTTACFSYFDLLRTRGVPGYVFDESRAMAELDYTYSDKGEGARRALHLASNLNTYPLDIAEIAGYLYEHRDEAAEKIIMERLDPENMICLLTAKGRDTDQTEEVYGTAYRYTEDTEFFAALNAPPVIPGLHLPEPNAFVPKQPKVIAEQPAKIVDSSGAVMWFSQDVEYDRPKISMSFRIRTDRRSVSLNQSARLSLYTSCINEQLNEFAYPARQAGLNYTVSANTDGTTIVVSGYSQSALQLFRTIAAQLRSVTLDATRYQAIQHRRRRGWSNFEQDAAWRVTRHEVQQLRQRTVFRPRELADEAAGISLEDIQRFAGNLYDRTYIEAVVHGNITADAARQALQDLRTALRTRPLPEDRIFRQGILGQPTPESLTFARTVPTNNSCFWRTYALGINSPEMRAVSGILQNFLHQPFYSEMRTQQQLGYIVWGGAMEEEDRYSIYFIIQSADYPADELRDRADAFIAGFPDLAAQMPDEQFEQLRQGFRQELLERPKSIPEKTDRFARLAFRRDGNFERIPDTVAALEFLTKDRVHEVLRAALDADSRRMVDVLTFADQHERKPETTVDIEDMAAFKDSRRYTTRHELTR